MHWKEKREAAGSDMGDLQPGQLVFVRHAPVTVAGRLFGRTDAEARIEPEAVQRARALLPETDRVTVSPAKRCRQTAAALWPDAQLSEDARLWEQDFGDHEGLDFGDLPDLGNMSALDLAAYAPPGGESFLQLSARASPAIRALSKAAYRSGETVVLVVHAGIVRAALGLTLGRPESGMVFEVPTLSVTRLRAGAEGPASIIDVSRT